MATGPGLSCALLSRRGRATRRSQEGRGLAIPELGAEIKQRERVRDLQTSRVVHDCHEGIRVEGILNSKSAKILRADSQWESQAALSSLPVPRAPSSEDGLRRATAAILAGGMACVVVWCV